jgi:hypothetical protein
VFALSIPFLRALWVVDGSCARSCPNHHASAPNDCTACHCRSTGTNNASCIVHHPPAALPPHSSNSSLQCPLDLLFTFPLARQQPIHSMHPTIIMTLHGFMIAMMEPIMATLSNSLLHPLSQHLQFHFASPAEQHTGKSAAASNSRRKRKLSSIKNTQSRKRPRVPAVPTTEPPSLICGVGPPTICDSMLTFSHLEVPWTGFRVGAAASGLLP